MKQASFGNRRRPTWIVLYVHSPYPIPKALRQSRLALMQDRRTSLAGSVSQTEVAKLYDRVAAVYDIWAHLTESRARRRSLALADVQNGQHVLDVATGTGLAFVDVVKRNPDGRNLGIDISEGMLSRARKQLGRAGESNFELLIRSALDIGEPDGSFDVVLNSYMFDLLDEHDWPRAVSEFHRVLKPNGKLVIVNMTFGEALGSNIYEWLYRVSPRLIGGCRGVRLAPVLEENGFSVQSREYVQQSLFPSEVILATKTGD